MQYRTISELKNEAMEHYKTLSTEECLKHADFHGDKMTWTDGSFGILPWQCCCIYINRDGKLMANKPKYNTKLAKQQYWND